MPRGAKPGERRGGRARGQPNKASVERAALAERIIAEAEGKPGMKLGKEMLQEFAVMFGGLAAAFQPVGTGPNGTLTEADIKTWAESYKEPLFEKYAKMAAKVANDFADFQSPRLARIQTAAPPPDPRGPIKKKFTINIFDHLGRPAPRHIVVNPTKGIVPSADHDQADFEPTGLDTLLKSK
jgi:hypothetical protein